jgi:tetratricopeptide (TPR) repeat protein
LRRRQGDLDGALADFEQAIRFDPGDAAAYNGRGRVRHARGDLPRAITDYDQALRLDPHFANAYNNRGTARKAMGDLEGAVADYLRALQFAPADGPFRATFERNLATARRRLADGSGK